MLHYIEVRKLYLLIWPIRHTQIRPIRDQNNADKKQTSHNKKVRFIQVHWIIEIFSCSNIHEYNKIEAMQYKKVVNITCHEG